MVLPIAKILQTGRSTKGVPTGGINIPLDILKKKKWSLGDSVALLDTKDANGVECLIVWKVETRIMMKKFDLRKKERKPEK